MAGKDGKWTPETYRAHLAKEQKHKLDEAEKRNSNPVVRGFTENFTESTQEELNKIEAEHRKNALKNSGIFRSFYEWNFILEKHVFDWMAKHMHPEDEKMPYQPQLDLSNLGIRDKRPPLFGLILILIIVAILIGGFIQLLS